MLSTLGVDLYSHIPQALCFYDIYSFAITLTRPTNIKGLFEGKLFTSPVRDVNKHLRPISLTSILSKLAEEIVVDRFVKPAVLKQIDPQQFGTVPGSSTTEALSQ